MLSLMKFRSKSSILIMLYLLRYEEDVMMSARRHTASLIIMGTFGDYMVVATDIHIFNAGSTRPGVTCKGHKNALLC